jgi:hypothetical protein
MPLFQISKDLLINPILMVPYYQLKSEYAVSESSI